MDAQCISTNHNFIILLILVFVIPGSRSIDVYLTTETIQGSSDNLTGICNVTGLVEQTIRTPVPCTSTSSLAWIGAYATYSPWFEYKGCGNFNMSAIDPVTKTFDAENISSCFENCFTGPIHYDLTGFWKSWCICLFYSDVGETFPCNNIDRCFDHSSLLCGDDESEKELVLYGRNYTPIEDSQNIGECMVANKSGNGLDFTSRDCSQNATVLCYNRTSKKNTPYTGVRRNWRDAIKFCETQDQIISSGENLTNINSPDILEGDYWISSVRIANYNKKEETKGPENYCVAAKIENNETMIPTVYPCGILLPVACISTGMEMVTNCSPTTQMTTYMTDDVFSNQTTGYKDDKGKKESRSLNLIPIIAGGVAGVVVLLTVIIIFICCKKSRNKKEKRADSKLPNSKNVQQNSANFVYDEVPRSSYNDTQNNIDTGIYDHTETSQNRNTEDANNYDSMAAIKQETEGMYDESKHSTGIKQEMTSDALYDLT